jgi:hypothetical protein
MAAVIVLRKRGRRKNKQSCEGDVNWFHRFLLITAGAGELPGAGNFRW